MVQFLLPMNDYSVFLKANEAHVAHLQQLDHSPKRWTPIEDIFFLPKNKTLQQYNPYDICMRLRTPLEGTAKSSLDEIVIQPHKEGYTTHTTYRETGSKETLLDRADVLGYEQWGAIVRRSYAYVIHLSQQETVSVSYQDIDPLGSYLKVEAQTEHALASVLDMLFVKHKDIIYKNSAVLLAEQMGLL
jgi:hypothetical protein